MKNAFYNYVWRYFASCLFLLLSTFLYAQDYAEASEDLIAGLSISGLKKTKLSIAERPLLRFIGIKKNELDTNEVWATIINTGSLEPLSVEIIIDETGAN